MKKLILSFTCLAAAASSAATAEERIAAIEARMADLEQRIAVLERDGGTAYRPNRPIYICRITPFQKTFEAADRNEGLARGKVRRTCNAETSSMFCEDRDIRCKRFD